MKQIFHPYWKWECYKNGMWKMSADENKLKVAIDFTGNHIKYGNAMRLVIENWKYSCENFLSNTSINRLAWLGHAAVSYRLNIEECITRKAWSFLNEEQRNLANNEAQQNVELWEQKRKLNATLKSGNEEAIQKEYQMNCQLELKGLTSCLHIEKFALPL